MIIEKGKTQRQHVAAPERAMWHDDISMTSPRSTLLTSPGSALLTSAVGPDDVSIDQVNIDH